MKRSRKSEHLHYNFPIITVVFSKSSTFLDFGLPLIGKKSSCSLFRPPPQTKDGYGSDVHGTLKYWDNTCNIIYFHTILLEDKFVT